MGLKVLEQIVGGIASSTTQVVVEFISAKLKKTSWYAKIGADDVATIDGKRRIFSDVDNCVLQVARALPASTKVVANCAVENVHSLAVVDPAVAAARAAATKASKMLKQQTVVSKLSAKISASSAWQNGTPAQKTAYTALTDQIAVAQAYLAFLA